jgi:hypothetical protein
MNTKIIFPVALLLVACGLHRVRAQEMTAPATAPLIDTTRVPAPPPEETVPGPMPPNPPMLSNWIRYVKPDCCGPIGCNGPIMTELFIRSGVSLPVEGKNFGHVLEPGWDIEAGGRAVFFDRDMSGAWDITMSISNVYNQGQHQDISFPYNIVTAATNPPTTRTVQVTVQDLNRTFVNLGIGKECYVGVPACVTSCCGAKRCRIGVDAGGRLGSGRVEFHELQHRTDVLTALYAALYADTECPCGCCTFIYGFRAEWDYMWSDLLQEQNNSDMQDLNFLFTIGVRF